MPRRSEGTNTRSDETAEALPVVHKSDRIPLTPINQVIYSDFLGLMGIRLSLQRRPQPIMSGNPNSVPFRDYVIRRLPGCGDRCVTGGSLGCIGATRCRCRSAVVVMWADPMDRGVAQAKEPPMEAPSHLQGPLLDQLREDSIRCSRLCGGPSGVGTRAAAESLPQRLDSTRGEVGRLRTENASLRKQLARSLGEARASC
jgi:hypothetical protein